MRHYDVVIMGGGLVGASLAACLARDSALQIAVVEKFNPPTQLGDFHPSFDARNTALTNGTCHLFNQLGIWAALRSNAEPIETIKISNQGGFGHATIRAQDERVRALGYVIENRYIGAELFIHLNTLRNVDFIAPAEISAITYDHVDRVTVSIEGTEKTQATTALLVVADGALSNGRELLGIQSSQTPYHQAALVTAFTSDRPHNNTAYERFAAGGPLALLPQTHDRFGVTWCVKQEEGEALAAMSDQDFIAALESVAGSAIGRIKKVGTRVLYPLSLVLAKEQVRPNVVVLGNAAHSLHPVAGQGLNMALRDVVVLTQALEEAKRRQQSLGDFAVLNRYLDLRTNDQFNTLQFSDKLTKLFTHPNAGVSLLRNTGLTLFDWLPGAKRFVARHAMGRSVSMQLPEIV